MTVDIRKEIESEIGKNGWRLVGKLTAAMGGIMLVPSVLGLVGYGALTNQVSTNIVEISSQRTRLFALSQKLESRSETQAVMLKEIEIMGKHLQDLAEVIEKMRSDRFSPYPPG
jgi:hypothetical protein